MLTIESDEMTALWPNDSLTGHNPQSVAPFFRYRPFINLLPRVQIWGLFSCRTFGFAKNGHQGQLFGSVEGLVSPPPHNHPMDIIHPTYYTHILPTSLFANSTTAPIY